MGGHLSSGLKRIVGRGQDLNLLMVGLTGAGKTTILHEMKLGDVEEQEPAPGLVIQTVTHKAFKTAVSFTVMDVGGDKTLEPCLLNHLAEMPNGLVFVVDSSDIARLEEAKAEFDRMLAFDGLEDAPLLVLVSKMDAPESMALSELAAKRGLHSLSSRRWRIQPCGVTDQGLSGIFKGLDWLAKILRSQASSPPSLPPRKSGGRSRSGTDVSSDTDSTTEPEEQQREESQERKGEFVDGQAMTAKRSSSREEAVTKQASSPQEGTGGARRRVWSWSKAARSPASGREESETCVV